MNGGTVWRLIVHFNNRFNSRPGPKDWRDVLHWKLAEFGLWLARHWR